MKQTQCQESKEPTGCDFLPALFIVLPMIIWACLWRYAGNEYFHLHWFFLMLGLSAALSVRLSKIEFSLGPAFFYLSASALYCVTYKFSFYRTQNPLVVLNVESMSAMTWMVLALGFWALISFNQRNRDYLEGFLSVFAYCLVLYTLYQRIFVSENITGFLGDKSINAAAAALLIPIVFRKPLFRCGEFVYLGLVLCVLCISHSHNPFITFFGVLIGAMVVFILEEKEFSSKNDNFGPMNGFDYIFMLFIPTIVFILGCEFVPDWFDFSGTNRLKNYDLFMSEWWNKHSRLFGTGFGTFVIWGPSIMMKANPDTQTIWYHMHSDVMQIFFETGIIGACLLALVFYRLIYLTIKKKQSAYLCLLFGYIALSCLQYPARSPITALIGLVAVTGALRLPANKHWL